ncbi:MAG TPA: ABC transporter permease [Vicinamibacterales bacterium]|nr:ABC transporter permease [Vicinamibacterales bacterium]
MWRDLRYAVTGFWRTPVFTIAAVAALGLAIGANATIFGLVDGLWFRPPGARHADGLVWLFATTTEDRPALWSYPEYETLRDRTRSFSGVVARGRRGASLRFADGSQELELVNVVSTNFFSTLGVAAAHGRLFGPGDEASLEAQPAVVLGYAFWRRRFGKDPSIVGRTIDVMRGRPLPVVVMGVLPESFRDLDAAADRDLWLPPQTWARLENRQTFAQRTDRWFDVLAVGPSGMFRSASLRRAQADVSAVASQMAQAFPETNAGRGVRVVSHVAYRMEEGGTNALALLGLVLLVVLITCVNVANLLLARAASRTREIAVRSAIGATRGRLLRQMLTESVVLGLLGAVAGVTLALWLIRLIPSLIIPPPGFRTFAVFQADGRVLAFTLAVTLLTTILFGVAPSWFATRADVLPLLKGAPAAERTRRLDRAVGPVLVILQVALAFVVLCAAALLIRSFDAVRGADIGVSNGEVLTAWVIGTNGTPSQMPAARLAVKRLAAVPGAVHVAVAFRAPLSLSGGGIAKPVILPDAPVNLSIPPPSIKFNAVSRDYFATLGIRVIAGRTFDAGDEQPGEAVVVVNEAFVHRFYPDGRALGSTLRFGTRSDPPHRIVGIVQNAAINAITERPEPYFYLPYWRAPYGEATFLVEAAGDAASLAVPVRGALRAVDPSFDPARMITMRQYIEFWSSGSRATAVLAVTLGLIGLVLTVLGVYGVIAYRTTRRTKEIGIRVALGADPRDVLRLIFREGASVAAAGIALGIPATLGATRAIRSLLFGVSAWDPGAYAAASALLFVSVCAAAMVPARRATRVAPSVSLKD